MTVDKFLIPSNPMQASQLLIKGFQTAAPVDLNLITAHLGLKVWEINNMPDTISGKLFRDHMHGGESGFSIAVNGHESYARKRFTIAHETAHFLLHKHLIGNGIEDDALYRSGLSTWMEVEANKLAADILMPYDLIQDVQRQGIRDIDTLAKRFEVSSTAMKIRLGVPVY